LFGLLRLDEGHFKFYTGTSPVHAVEPQDVAPVLDEAESRLVQWAGIAAAVPSLYSRLSLQASAEGPVTLSADQWQLVATIGGGQSVADVLKTGDLGEFEGCKAVKELVDLHLVHVDSSDVPPTQQLLTPLADRPPEQVPAYSSERSPDFADQPSDHVAANGSGNGSQYSDHALGNGSEHTADLLGASPGAGEWASAGQATAHVDEVADLSEVWHEDDAPLPTEDSEPVEDVAVPKPEPVNRGLLLKFLGSARN
jgi:hypothetical protein